MVQVVGAVDIDPQKVGKTLGQLWGAGRSDGEVRVVSQPSELDGDADVAFVTTSSRLATLESQLEPLFGRGLHVISSAEELFYPALSDPHCAARIDALARRHGVSVTGAGVNPGFVMDVLPVVLAVASGPPITVRCERYVDLTQRRVPLQVKAGLGLKADEFRRRAEEIQIGHVGLIESTAYLAGQLGFPIHSIEESLDPVVAEAPFEWNNKRYEAGTVIGFIHQTRAWGEGQSASKAPVQFYLRMSYRQADPHDRVVIEGTPRIDMTIRPCVAGDPATAAILVHLAARSPFAPHGLCLVHELGLLPQAPRQQVSFA
jgi:4-hydroxy-tetrahydrodipicolinate reductase